jgi:hypothetical protein
MATILEFRAHDAGSASSSQTARGQATGSAELIFFPGVRYERAEQAPAPAPRARTKRRQNLHDRMNLPE